MTAGRLVYVPKMLIFRGGNAARWGRDGVPRTPLWHWWSPPALGAIRAIDQDGDVNPDVEMYLDLNAKPGQVSVLYGRAGELPDTNDVETVSLAGANGHTSILSDITGDHIPELSVACGTDEVVRVFVGRRGQRLKEQFGSGSEPPHPGNPDHWWGRPWAEIWLPRKFDPIFNSAGFQPLLDLGDVGLDSVGDLFPSVVDGVSTRFIGCYNGGRYFDNYIDAMVDVPGAFRGARSMGDIDGSGVPSISISWRSAGEALDTFPGGVLFCKATRSVPRSGELRPLPAGTDVPAGIGEGQSKRDLESTFQLWPNPASDRVQASWDQRDGVVVISFSDLLGHELKRVSSSARAGGATIEFGGWPAGTYFVTLHSGINSSTRRLILK